jgi:hypothetical protein
VTVIAVAEVAEVAEVRQLETRLALRSIFFQTDEPRIGNSSGGLVISQKETGCPPDPDRTHGCARVSQVQPGAFRTSCRAHKTLFG